jgi:hypothetical protein
MSNRAQLHHENELQSLLLLLPGEFDPYSHRQAGGDE